MQWDFYLASFVNLGANLIYTVAALFIGLWALLLVDRILLKDIDIQEEMKKGNMAVALFASTILIFVAIIVSFGFKA